MGTLHSASDWTGMTVGKVTLGQPARNTDEHGETLSDSDYRWDDGRLPNGVIKDDGTITVDESEGI